jgi:hypothetical protein
MGPLSGDILLIPFLAIEVNEVLTEPKVRGFVFGSSRIFDVIESGLVLAGGGNCRASTDSRTFA